MRHVWLCAILCAVSATTGHAKSNASRDQSAQPVLTIVLEFRGPHGARSVEEMEHEVENILRGAGRAIEWRSWEQATQAVFDELAVVRFTGNCGDPPWPNDSTADGPLGFTYISNGAVLPFSEIACERFSRAGHCENGAGAGGNSFRARHGARSRSRADPHDFGIHESWPRRYRPVRLLSERFDIRKVRPKPGGSAPRHRQRSPLALSPRYPRNS
jgi:hypothetical protein